MPASRSDKSVTNEPISVGPIVRWAGSKSRILDRILPYVPKTFRTYYEPFFGSGALFFRLRPRTARLGDMCVDLVDTYSAVRDNCDRVIEHLRPLKLNEKTYYEQRGNQPRGRYQAAARFLYLNRGCWNGLYRVNTRGEFNVPYGRPKTPNVFDPALLRSCSKLLAQPGVTLQLADFEETLKGAGKGDFVFLDPPYVTKHNLNGFAEWNEQIFSWADQERLAETAARLRKKGAFIVVTNADHKDVIGLYPGFTRSSLTRFSTLAGDMKKRAVVTEAILCSGDFPGP